MTPKEVKGVAVYNLSGQPLGEAVSLIPHSLKAQKVVLLPDLGPIKHNRLPTGIHVQLDESVQPEWRRFALSDIGCGMQVLESPLSWSDFEANLSNWDRLHQNLMKNKGKLGDLGSGNHFLDAAVDNEERLHFIIHTGSRGESPLAEELVDSPREFDQEFVRIVNWARANRDQIREEVESIYGNTKLTLDKAHNFYIHEDKEVRIYKGAMALKPGQVGIIPSSMAGEMAIVEGTKAGNEINNAMSHGTGRTMSRSQAKPGGIEYDFDALRRKIHIPNAIPDRSLVTDYPESYRDLDATLDLLGDLVNVVKKLVPIAYLGQT